jgi:hypothetical protein
MAIKAVPDPWAALNSALELFAASGSAEVREDGEWLADLAAFKHELRTDGKDPVIHLWSDARNLTRRIVSIREQSPDRIVLDVLRFGRERPVKLEFLRKDEARPEARITREQFRSRFARVLAERFPDATVDSLSVSENKSNQHSGVYVRGVMHEGSRAWALLAASPAESDANVEGILAFGLLWLDWARGRSTKRGIEGLRLFVPEGGSLLLRERLLALGTAAQTDVFEMCGPDYEMRRVPISDAGNLESWLVPRQDIDWLLAKSQDAYNRIRELLPVTAGDIELRPSPESKEVAFCCRGLEFARYTREGLVFGGATSHRPLTERSLPKLRNLIRDLDLYRNAQAEDKKQPLYRAAPERWLESVVRADPSRLDATLDPRFLYSQTPVWNSATRGVIDVLGITRQKRLVIIELKAKEDMQLPLQAVDYWLRVRRHQQQNDFQQEGYFSGVEIDPRPPLVWLVAPSFQFHSSTEALVKCLSPEIQVSRVGLNENWRLGIKVAFRR